MGRSAMFLVMALGMAFTVIGINLRNTGTEATRFETDYFKYASARNLARTAVYLRLRAIDNGLSLVGPMEGIFNDGRYFTHIDTTGNDTLHMLARGIYPVTSGVTIGTGQAARYDMNITLVRFPKPFPVPNAALGIRATPVLFEIKGGATIDGTDHDINGNATGGAGLPGVTVMTAADSASVMAGGGSTGISGGTQVKVDTTTPDPKAYIQEYISNADRIFTQADSPVNSNLTIGSPADPQIVVCYTPDTTVNVTFNGTVEGWGLLVISGSVRFAGTFTWHGLVIVAGDENVIQVTASSGTPQIIGGIIMSGGANSEFYMRGNVGINYSKEAIETAKWIKKLLAYRIMSWYERGS